MLTLYYHPFSSYCWKVLIPLYEAGTPFTPRRIDDPPAAAEWKRRWPIARFPVLVEEESGLALPEASIIIEYLDSHYPGPQPMLPGEPGLRLEVRLLDRFFDNYLHASVQKIVADRLRDAGHRDAQGVEEARAMLGTCYAWLEARMADREWAAGPGFTIADCAAAPALFYADWVHPIGDAFPNVTAYRARLLARPSVKRAIDDARPFRALFPGGAPDQD
ncbi:MAG TPA: glutathione S-transferase family protein [Acetobacteraceae bacterium]|nr:glutathione S-transferase family protein [Acetobacteraceae bacterium]